MFKTDHLKKKVLVRKFSTESIEITSDAMMVFSKVLTHFRFAPLPSSSHVVKKAFLSTALVRV
jgi:hypothetical protein